MKNLDMRKGFNILFRGRHVQTEFLAEFRDMFKTKQEGRRKYSGFLRRFGPVILLELVDEKRRRERRRLKDWAPTQDEWVGEIKTGSWDSFTKQ